MIKDKICKADFQSKYIFLLAVQFSPIERDSWSTFDNKARSVECYLEH